MWDRCRGYFIYSYFMPFLFLNFLPLVIVAFCSARMEQLDDDDTSAWVFLVYFASMFLFVLGVLYQIGTEIYEMRQATWKKYCKDKGNIYQWLVLTLSVGLIV